MPVDADRMRVSTLSRPKAADFMITAFKFFGSFNTQPPEGGWL